MSITIQRELYFPQPREQVWQAITALGTPQAVPVVQRIGTSTA